MISRSNFKKNLCIYNDYKGRFAYFLMYFKILLFNGLFKRKKDDKTQTKCDVCGTELHDPERLKRHMKKSTWKCTCKEIRSKFRKMVVRGNMELNSGKKASLVFVGAFLTAGIVLSTMVFPFGT